MKIVVLSFLVWLFCMPALAQTGLVTEPFIIQGKLTNFTKGDLILFFRDSQKDYKEYIIENIQADSSGRFYLKTYAVTKPVKATLRKEELSIDIYAAAGYDLTLTGDVRDIRLFMQQKKIAGKGAESNQFLFGLDSLLYSSKDTVQWYEMRQKELLGFVKKDERMRDSLYNSSFSKKVNDKWFNHFARVSELDNTFMKMYYLISHIERDTTLNYNQSVLLLSSHFDKKILANLFNEEYLVSENYLSWLTGTYPSYLRSLEIRKNGKYANDKEYDIQILDQIATHFKGKIKDIKLYTRLKHVITYCRSFEELMIYKNNLPGYIALLTDKSDRVMLDSLLAEKEKELLNAQIGQLAPVFHVPDSTGAMYKLSDYKGKVVYLDLWASWCGPCRAETPYLKTLTEKYKNNSNVIFISIAVLDKPDNWRKALMKDKPTWLQLYDKEGAVQRDYFSNSIPKFIVINKKGEIVSFDAPAPSSGKELEAMLDREMAN